MGKGYAKKKPRVLKRDFKEKRPDEWEERRIPNETGDGYKKTPTENEAFEEYYKHQEIVPDGEWDDFMTCLRSPLPATFRINGSGKFAAQLRDKLETDFFSKLQQAPEEVEGERLIPPRPLAWYPQKLAWQLTYSRTQLRKLDSLVAVHELLKQENLSGGITRQEAVSMAPPLFLDIQPHHKILDTCAAPGSKTVQMLEMLHADGTMPSGFVVANDSEPQRCNLLVHQTNRMHSPALVVTNHDASGFPLLNQKAAPKSEALRFDRILCDVPCSGDGTLRKAPDLWRRWHANQGTGLHALQVRITLHTAGLLAVGGRMVYSTCSFNPVEDEAVVAEVLRQSNGSLELLDVSERMPELKRTKGKQQWRVKGTKGQYFSTLEAAAEAKNDSSLSASMFPDEASDQLPLERCMRILPHHGDTGGFFIAVLQKRAEMPPLQPDRWKKSRDLQAEKWRKEKATENPENPPSHTAEKTAPSADAAGGLKDTDEVKPFSETPGEEGPQPPKQEQPDLKPEKREFDKDVELCADSAAQAAVTFADAIADQDAHAAVEASEEAADAVEEVADRVEALENGHNAEAAAEGQGSVELGTPKDNNDEAEKKGVDLPAKAPRQRQRRRKPGEEPIQFISDKEVLDSIVEFFGLEADFPIRQQLVTRSGVKDERGPKKIYFITSGMVDLVLKDEDQALKVTSAGLRMFERKDQKDSAVGQCMYRMAQDGLRTILPHVTKQILHPSATEMLRLLKERNVPLPAGQKLHSSLARPHGQADSEEPPPKRVRTEAEDADDVKEASASELAEKSKEATEDTGDAALVNRVPISDLQTLQELGNILGGCCICTLREEEAAELGLQGPLESKTQQAISQIAIVCWRGRASLAILVDKPSAKQMAEKLEDALQQFAGRNNPLANIVGNGSTT